MTPEQECWQGYEVPAPKAVWANLKQCYKHMTFKETRKGCGRRAARLHRITLKMGGTR